MLGIHVISLINDFTPPISLINKKARKVNRRLIYTLLSFPFYPRYNFCTFCLFAYKQLLWYHAQKTPSSTCFALHSSTDSSSSLSSSLWRDIAIRLGHAVRRKHLFRIANAPSQVPDIAIGLYNFRRKFNAEHLFDGVDDSFGILAFSF